MQGQPGTVNLARDDFTTQTPGHPNSFNPMQQQLLNNDAELAARTDTYQEEVNLASVDAKGRYKIVAFKRPNGTLYMRSTLSNPDANGNYQTDTWEFYNAAGAVKIKTRTWTLTNDAKGIVTNKTFVETTP